MKRELFAILIVAILGLSLGIYARHLLYSTYTETKLEQKQLTIEYKLIPLLKIEVIRDQKIVSQYCQIDPPTENFMWMLEVIFWPNYEWYEGVTNLGGTIVNFGKSPSYTETFTSTGSTDPRILILLGNGSSPSFSRSAYALQNEVEIVVASDPSLSANSTHAVLSIAGSWTASYNVTITEVGLSMRFDIYDADNNNYDEILLLYTPLDSPVDLVENDTITVTYEFAFPEPFTVQMAKLFQIIFFPYSSSYTTVNATDGTIQDIGIRDANPNAYDFFSHGNSDILTIAIGNGTASWNIWKYSLANFVNSNTASISVSQGDQGTYITITATIGISSSINATEIGLCITGEIYDSTDNNYVELLLVYFALDSPVQVEAGESLEVTIKLVFP